ncbi:TMEM175 family protein [Furfurilactobacillus siliginis]
MSLFSEWPVFFAYVVSFGLIYMAWYAHHNTFKQAANITQTAFLWNGVWLFFLTLVPFITNWVGKSPNNQLAELVYVIVQFAWVLTYNILNGQVQRDNPDMPIVLPYTPGWRTMFGGGFLVAAVSTLLVPILGLILTGVVSIWSFIQLFKTYH